MFSWRSDQKLKKTIVLFQARNILYSIAGIVDTNWKIVLERMCLDLDQNNIQ